MRLQRICPLLFVPPMSGRSGGGLPSRLLRHRKGRLDDPESLGPRNLQFSPGCVCRGVADHAVMTATTSWRWWPRAGRRLGAKVADSPSLARWLSYSSKC